MISKLQVPERYDDAFEQWTTDEEITADEVNDYGREVWQVAYDAGYDKGHDEGQAYGETIGAEGAHCPTEDEHAESLSYEAPFLTDVDARMALVAIIQDAARNPASSLRWESARVVRVLSDWARYNSNAYSVAPAC